MPKLKNARREHFCLEYVKDFNGAQAAIRAGFAKHRAEQSAYQILTSIDVKNRVEELKAEKWRKWHMSADEAIALTAAAARFDTRKLYDQDGNMLPPHEWDDQTAMAIAGVEVVDVTVRDEDGGKTVITTRTKKVKAVDPLKARELLMRHHNLFSKEAATVGAAAGGAFSQALQVLMTANSGVAGLVKVRKA